MQKIKLDHTELDTPAYIVRMRAVSTALSGAPFFAPQNAKLAPFDNSVNVLETKNNAVDTAEQALKQAITERDAARDDVEVGVRGLASASEGETLDPALLQSGGWHLRGIPTPVGPMPAPGNLVATTGDMEGEVDLSWDPVKGRDTYIGELSTSATGPWTQFYVGKKSGATATGLISGSMYWFRVLAIGAAGRGPWSDPAQKRAA
jgi:hypothetical protein